jgi:predicted HTH transcriptional regulator
MLKTGEVGRVKKILSDKPISEIEDLIKKGENSRLEFKSDALWSLDKTEQDIKESKSYDLHTYRHKASKVIIARSIAALLNSEGGNLVIGIKEKKDSSNHFEIIGIEEDLRKLKLLSKDSSKDGYKRMLIDDIIRPYFPSKVYNQLNQYIKIDFEELDEKILCNIKIKKSPAKIFLNLEGKKIFMIRTETESRQIVDEELVDYCMSRFSN